MKTGRAPEPSEVSMELILYYTVVCVSREEELQALNENR